MAIKTARELQLGDTIIVNLGMGKTEKIVDRVNHDPDAKTVDIVLFVSSGRRPKFVLTEDQQVEIVG